MFLLDFQEGGGLTTILSYAILYSQSKGGLMNAAKYHQTQQFKLFMCANLGLLKDGKMGATQERADRIKTALSYMRERMKHL